MPTTDPDPVVVPLDEVECRVLLLGSRLGRLAFTRNALPAIQPVPYRLHGGEVVIPAPAGSPYLPGARGAVVALGVDAYDGDTGTGWSVTVVGQSRAVDDPAEAAVLDALPWSRPRSTGGGGRYVALGIGVLSGWRTGRRAR
jgi:nitroimidazol reductase NimA-like FMN-containing flavoprotein (pyridoxamine 5'-phosphate oxidase superfamily)